MSSYINFDDNQLNDFNDSYSDYSDYSYNSTSNFDYELDEKSSFISNPSNFQQFTEKMIQRNYEQENEVENEVEDELDDEQENEHDDKEYKPIIKRKYVKKNNNTIKKTKDTKKQKVSKYISQTHEQRIMRNRESARLCRLRKKQYILNLEQRISELTDENNSLKALLSSNSIKK